MDEVLKRILDLLKENGKTQNELTKVLGISSSAVTEWKKGKMKSYNHYLYQIAEYFNVSVQYLLTGENKKIAPGTTESDVSDVEMIAVKATEKEWNYILNRLSQENRDKLQEQAELLLLKQRVQADKEEK